MKKCLIVIVTGLLSFLSVNTLFSATDIWTRRADLGDGWGGEWRDYAVGFSIGNKGYIGTGGALYKKDFWEYDPTSNTWTQKADFGGSGRSDAVGFSIGTKGYIGTGFTGSSLKKDFWEYDSIANTWTQKADFGGTARWRSVGFSIGTKGYIGTGWDVSSAKKDFWEYDSIANTWTQKADFGGTARDGAVGFSIGDKGYIGTGNDFPYPYQRRKDFWEYDSIANTWTQKTDFGGAIRFGAVGFSIGNKGYIGTGSADGEENDFWEYDSIANTWTQKTDFGGAIRFGAVGFSIGNKGYIGTGSSKKDFWVYHTGTTGDYNNDGKPDLVWRNPITGENVVYYMDGVTILSGVYLPTVDPGWTLAGH